MLILARLGVVVQRCKGGNNDLPCSYSVKEATDASPSRLFRRSHIDTYMHNVHSLFLSNKKWHAIHATRINYCYPNSVCVHVCINMYVDLIVSSTINMMS